MSTPTLARETPRELWQIYEDIKAHVTTVRGLCELYETQQRALEEIVEGAAGVALWGKGGFLMRTPEVSARSDAWYRRNLVLMDAEAHLLAELDEVVGELAVLVDPAVA